MNNPFDLDSFLSTDFDALLDDETSGDSGSITPDTGFDFEEFAALDLDALNEPLVETSWQDENEAPTYWGAIKDRVANTFAGLTETIPASMGLAWEGFKEATIDSGILTEQIDDWQRAAMSMLPGGSMLNLLDETMNPYRDMDFEQQQKLMEGEKAQIRDTQNLLEQRIAAYTPENLDWMQEGIRAGIESTAQNLPGMAATFATGNPLPMLAGFGVLTGSRSYGDARKAGKSAEESASYALKDASVEVLTELLPTKYLTGMFKAPGFKKFAQFTLSELGGEALAEFMQSLNAYAHDLDEELRDVVDPREFALIMGERELVAVTAAAVGAGLQTGAAVAANAMTRLGRSQTVEEAIQAANDVVDSDIDVGNADIFAPLDAGAQVTPEVTIPEVSTPDVAHDGGIDFEAAFNGEPADTITVYAPDGQANQVTVVDRSEAGSIKIQTPDGGEEIVGETYTLTNPAAPDFSLDTFGVTVSSLSDEELDQAKARLDEKIQAQKDEGGTNAAIMSFVRERNAITFEQKRREGGIPFEPTDTLSIAGEPIAQPGMETVDFTTEIPDFGIEEEADAARRIELDTKIRQQERELAGVTLPENYDDPRLGRLPFRKQLSVMLKDLTKEGGKLIPKDGATVRDPEGRNALEKYGSDQVVRLPSLNPEWFKNNNWTIDMVEGAVKAALSGKKLGKRQASIIDNMLGHIEDVRMERELPYAKDQLEAARTLRGLLGGQPAKIEGVTNTEMLDRLYDDQYISTLGQQYEDSFYLPDFNDPQNRAIQDLAAEAMELDHDGYDALVDSLPEQGAEAVFARELLNFIGDRRGQATAEQAAESEFQAGFEGPIEAGTPEGLTEAPAAAAEEITGEIYAEPETAIETASEETAFIEGYTGESNQDGGAPESGGPALESEVSETSPVVSPQQVVVRDDNTLEFTATHVLSDGTEVTMTGEPNVWVDAEGVEIEDEYAEPIQQARPAVESPKQVIVNEDGTLDIEGQGILSEAAEETEGQVYMPQEQYEAIIDALDDEEVDFYHKKITKSRKKLTTDQKRQQLREMPEAETLTAINEIDKKGGILGSKRQADLVEERETSTEEGRFDEVDDWDMKVANFPVPDQTRDFKKELGAEYISMAEAKQRLADWKAKAKQVGETEDHSNEVILSLFDESGIISQPWRDAGYDVLQYDILLDDDLMEFFPTADLQEIEERGKKVVGIIAQPPCTCFSASGAQFWEERHDTHDRKMVNKMFGAKAATYFSKPKEYTKMLVSMVDLMIEFASPNWVVMENPVGRIAEEMGLPDPVVKFQPHNFGDPYTKQTWLWGNFDPTNMPTANVDPTEGSKMHKLSGSSEKAKGERSKTSVPFAYALFMGLRNEPSAVPIPYAEDQGELGFAAQEINRRYLGELSKTMLKEVAKELGVPYRKGGEDLIDRIMLTKEMIADLSQYTTDQELLTKLHRNGEYQEKLKTWAEALYPERQVVGAPSFHINFLKLNKWGAATGNFYLEHTDPVEVKKVEELMEDGRPVLTDEYITTIQHNGKSIADRLPAPFIQAAHEIYEANPGLKRELVNIIALRIANDLEKGNEDIDELTNRPMERWARDGGLKIALRRIEAEAQKEEKRRAELTVEGVKAAVKDGDLLPDEFVKIGIARYITDPDKVDKFDIELWAKRTAASIKRGDVSEYDVIESAHDFWDINLGLPIVQHDEPPVSIDWMLETKKFPFEIYDLGHMMANKVQRGGIYARQYDYISRAYSFELWLDEGGDTRRQKFENGELVNLSALISHRIGQPLKFKTSEDADAAADVMSYISRNYPVFAEAALANEDIQEHIADPENPTTEEKMREKPMVRVHFQHAFVIATPGEALAYATGKTQWGQIVGIEPVDPYDPIGKYRIGAYIKESNPMRQKMATRNEYKIALGRRGATLVDAAIKIPQKRFLPLFDPATHRKAVMRAHLTDEKLENLEPRNRTALDAPEPEFELTASDVETETLESDPYPNPKDKELIAKLLGLDPKTFWQNVRNGNYEHAKTIAKASAKRDAVMDSGRFLVTNVGRADGAEISQEDLFNSEEQIEEMEIAAAEESEQSTKPKPVIPVVDAVGKPKLPTSEKIKQMMTEKGGESSGVRAKPGGEYGINGEWYEGGQFLPSSAKTIKGKYRSNAGAPTGTGRVLVAPGVWGFAPEGMSPIFARIKYYVENAEDPKAGLEEDTPVRIMEHMAYKKDFPWEGNGFRADHADLDWLIDRYNKGQRFYTDEQIQIQEQQAEEQRIDERTPEEAYYEDEFGLFVDDTEIPALSEAARTWAENYAWDRKDPDYRSEVGSKTHPSILHLNPETGATELWPLATFSDAELLKEIGLTAEEAEAKAEETPVASIGKFRDQKGAAEKSVGKLINDLGLQEEIMRGEEFHVRIKNEPYEDLVIERQPGEKAGLDRIYLTHYREQNGDQILDAEMVFTVRMSDGKLYLKETAVENPRGGESRYLDRGFAKMFANNLNQQGFGSGQIVRDTDTAEAPAEPEITVTTTKAKIVPTRQGVEAVDVTETKEQLDANLQQVEREAQEAGVPPVFDARQLEKQRQLAELEKQESDYGKSNTLFTEDAAEKAREILRKKLNQTSAGIDPEIMQAGITLAGYHVEAGARKFTDYAKAMINDLGEGIKPYLKSLYLAVYNWPGMDTAGMTDPAQVNDELLDAAVALSTTESRETAILGVEEEGNEQQTNIEAGTQRGESYDLFANDEVNAQPAGTMAGPRGEQDRGSNRSGNLDSGTQQRTQRERDGQNQAPDDGTGTSEGDRAGTRSRSHQDAVKRTEVSSTNYRITESDNLGKGGAITKARQNIRAIELLKQLEAENRGATAEEQAELAKYVGWGMSELANNMFPVQGRELKGEWVNLHDQLKALLTEEEYEQAARTTQYAHYTSPEVIRSIYDGLSRIGVKGGVVLEPGMGTGNFVGLMPSDMAANSHYTGIEFDSLTARIADNLYPESSVHHADFTEFAVEPGAFDLVIGNPPFSSTVVKSDPIYKKYGFNLHEYFFAKSIDSVRDGGVVVFVTSRFLMDRVSDKARSYIQERANLLGAVRLPQTAFKENAGTEVVTDILFLQKRAEGTQAGGEAWTDLGEIAGDGNTANVNQYFIDNPEMVLGAQTFTGSMYGKNEYTVEPTGDIVQGLANAVSNLPEGVYETGENLEDRVSAQREAVFAPEHKQGAFFMDKEGNLLQVGVGNQATKVNQRQKGKKGGLYKSHIELIKKLVPMKEKALAVLDAQINNKPYEDLQRQLNLLYDSFYRKYGAINKTRITESRNARTGKLVERVSQPNIPPAFRQDPDWVLLTTLDDFDPISETSKKNPILTDRVLEPDRPPVIETAPDALASVLNTEGRIDVEKIAKMLDTSEADAVEMLGDLVYQNPTTGAYETADEYLSGNVREKLRQARAAANDNAGYARNVTALEEVQPADLMPSAITARLGVAWVPPSDVEAFASEIMGMSARITYSHSGHFWAVDDASEVDGALTGQYTTQRMSAKAILQAALDREHVTIRDTIRNPDGSTSSQVNVEQTELARQKVTDLKEAFERWVWQDGGRADRLARLYNDKFNDIVPRQYDGSHLTLPGVSSRYDLRPHQKRVIWRIIQDGNTYMAHMVGAGKTMAAVAAGMEQKRLGLIKKPMYVVPNHMLQQFSSEFLELYPAAKILVADEEGFQGNNRRKFVARAASEPWDAVIMTHSSFKLIKAPAAKEEAMIQTELDKYREALENVDKEDRVTRKRLEKMVEQQEQNLSEVKGRAADKSLSFDQMGVDFLFIDEAHEFRKLSFATSQGQIKGIDPAGSQKAWDLYVKSQYLNDIRPGRNLVLMSGTPVTNTLGEMFTLQRYLQGDELARKGIDHFDSWVGQFADTKSVLEQNPDGNYKLVTRLALFVNMPELLRMFRDVADVVRDKDLDGYVERPVVKGGKVNMNVVPATPAMKGYQQQLASRIKAIEKRKGPPQKGDDILLTVITDGRHAALDDRYIDPEGTPGESKLQKLIDNVYQIWEAGSNTTYFDANGEAEAIRGSTQMVFSNLGVNERDGFSAYQEIKAALMAKGVPENEIAFMQDYKKAAQKLRLYADMNTGRKRILIGSTIAMGTGVNAQQRLAAIHHLDAPWYPADMDQRNGRGVRQGNKNKEIALEGYATEGTYDSTMFSLLETKQGFIDQMWTEDFSVREMEDLDGDANQYAIARAMSSGDERLIRKITLEQEIAKLERQRNAAFDEKHSARALKSQNEARIASWTDDIAKAEKELEQAVVTTGKEFKATIRGKTYDERKKAGEAILTQIIELNDKPEKEGKEYVIGQLGGFDVTVLIADRDKAGYRSFLPEVYLEVTGVGGIKIDMDKSPLGVITSLENQSAGIQKRIDDWRDNMRGAQVAIDRANAVLEGAGFQKEAELNELLEELQELEEELLAESETEATAEQGVIEGEVVSSAQSAGPENISWRPIWQTPENQEYKSADASINKQRNPVTIGLVEKHYGGWESGSVNADIGGGMYDNVIEYLAKQGVENYIYDPYNRTDEFNANAIEHIKDGQADTATINNTLNVIKEPDIRNKVLREAANALKPGGTVYIQIYEGDGTGEGRHTKGDIWQENRKARDYLEEVRRVFPDADIKHGLITAKNTIVATKASDEGVYLRGERPSYGHTKAEVRKWLKRPISKLGNWVNVEIVQSVDELPDTNSPDDVSGLLWKGKVYLVADNIEDLAEAKEAFAHEVVGHLGLETLLGKKGFTALVNQVQTMKRSKNQTVLNILDEIKENYVDEAGEYNLDEQMESREILAHLAQRKPNASLVRRVMSKIKLWLARHGLGNFDDALLESLLVRAAKITQENYVGNIDTGDAYSRSGSIPRHFGNNQTFQTPEGNEAWNTFMTQVVNRFDSLQKIIKEIETALGHKITEDQDADTAEILYHGRAKARQEDYTEKYIKPILKLVDKTGQNFEDVGEWLHARHAAEANEVLKGRNPDRPDNEALSGMSDEEAAEILERHKNNRVFQMIGNAVDRMNTERLQEMVTYELLSLDQASQWNGMYQHYIPLNRAEAEEDSGGMPLRGRGFDLHGRESKLRAGSTKAVNHKDVLPRMFVQYYNTIARGEKNRVAKALYNLASENPNKEIWTTERSEMPQHPILNEAGEVEYRPSAFHDDYTLSAKFEGEEKWVYFNRNNSHARRVVTAMKNLDAGSSSKILRAFHTFNRYLSAVSTGWNPEFWVSNLARDLQTAMANLTDTEADNLQIKIIADAPKAIRAAYDQVRHGKEHEWGQWMKEFRAEGGMTGWLQSYENIADATKKMENLMKSEHMGYKQLNYLKDFVGDVNMAIENGVRLSTYVHSRKNGLSKTKAARIAKEVTVNFNRRGEAGVIINSFYLFGNASIQGSYRLLRAVGNKKNKKLRAALVGTVIFAAMLDMINRAFGGDDDDGEPLYDKIPDYEKDRNLIFMDYFGLTGSDDKKYIKIPLPWGYNIFHVIGQELGTAIDAARGQQPEWSVTDRSFRTLNAVLEAFNPVNDGTLLQTLSPTALDPFVRIAENKDWHGGPLAPKKFSNAQHNVDLYYSSSSAGSRWLTRVLHDMTLDTDTQKAWLDWSPEWLDMGGEFLTGGVGKFLNQTIDGTYKLLASGEDIEAKRIPFVRRVFGEVSDGMRQGDGYDRLYEIIDLDLRLNRIKKTNKEAYLDMRDLAGDRISLIQFAKVIKKRVSGLRKLRDAAREDGDTMAAEDYQSRITEELLKFSRKYRDTVY